MKYKNYVHIQIRSLKIVHQLVNLLLTQLITFPVPMIIKFLLNLFNFRRF